MSVHGVLALAAIIAAGGEAGHGGGSNALLTPDWALTIATWLTFLLLAGFLAKFGWGPFVKALDDRESKVAENARRAEEARSQAEGLLKSYEEKLASARAEADKFIAESRARAEAASAKELEKARVAAEELTVKARASIEGERQKAVADLNRIVAGAAASLAGRILKAEIDPAKHQKLVDEVVSGIPAKR